MVHSLNRQEDKQLSEARARIARPLTGEALRLPRFRKIGDGVSLFLHLSVEICYNRSMKYLIIIHKSKYGYDTHAPALPGCHSQGGTKREALENIKDAIFTYLQMEKEELKGAEVKEVEVVFA